MSSKLVRKGLDLVNSEGGLRSQKRKSAQKEKRPTKKRKRTSKPNKQQPRGVQGLRLSSGKMKKTQQADFTEKNLEYFKKATWKIKKDTYDKILERQNKLQRNKNVDEKHEESETEETGGLFDD
ncbi:hypothetical protein ACROYT_G038317 [Oculina patagonica]